MTDVITNDEVARRSGHRANEGYYGLLLIVSEEDQLNQSIVDRG